MALNFNAPATATANAFEKATAFINCYIETPTGKRKVGALPLKASKPFEAALIERLSKDDNAIEAMMDVIQLDFQLVNNEPVAQDSLGF